VQAKTRFKQRSSKYGPKVKARKERGQNIGGFSLLCYVLDMAENEQPVLLQIEDDPNIALATRVFAEQKGYLVHRCDNGPEGLKMAGELQPDVILLDIGLPGLDGRDVMSKLRSEHISDDAIIIFTTAREAQSDRVLGLELGADDYETKPLDFDRLFNKIQALREKRQS